MSNEAHKIYGVFSSQEIRKVGTGTTTRKVVSKVFWFVEEIEDGNISMQSINANYIPTGVKRTIDKDTLLQNYFPEPEYYTNQVYPKIKELDEKVEEADSHRKKGELFTAEFEYGNALQIDVDNVKANFGIGLTYLERGDTEKASNIFDRLVNLEGTYQPEHKHLFNEFGISLRKSKLYNEAVHYYEKALELNEVDENLHLNIARVYFELKQIDKCCASLARVLELSPSHEIGLKFAKWLYGKKLVSKEQYLSIVPADGGKSDKPEQAGNGEVSETKQAQPVEENKSSDSQEKQE